jgi:hypothetical protein
MEDEDDNDEDDVLFLFFIRMYQKYCKIRYERNPEHQVIQRKDLRFNDISDSDCWDLFRFRRHGLYEIYYALRVPEWVIIEDGRKVNGHEALMLTLYRLARPRTYLEAVRIFGRDVTLWCKVFICMIHYIFPFIA